MESGPTLWTLLTEVIRPGHFFAREGTTLEFQFLPTEEIPWEIYQGRLLDSSQTRSSKAFERWSIFWVDNGGRSEEPVLSLNLDRDAQQVHVVRAIHSYAWQGYDAGDNVFLSQEVCKWMRELVGTVSLGDFTSAVDLRTEIISLLFQAVVGCRLPITSLETPLPSFSLGQFAYFYRPIAGDTTEAARPMSSVRDLIQSALNPAASWLEKTKLLETVLRAVPWPGDHGTTRGDYATGSEEVNEAAQFFAARWKQIGHRPQEICDLCRTLFNEVSLTPYTGFVDRFLLFLQALVNAGHLRNEQYADLLSYLLRQTARHLTAYDLVKFHHRGANYPDALFLDAALKDYLALTESQPGLFLPGSSDAERMVKKKRLRRRALRQAWFFRRSLEGLPVPDEPTSPGENARVLPPPHSRLPEEQIVEPAKRTKRLFAEDPFCLGEGKVGDLLRASVQDLHHPEELVELGMAVFLDRPLGASKQPGEPDGTMLFSFEAFSRSIAQQRLQYLDRTLRLMGDPLEMRHPMDRLHSLPVDGIRLAAKPRRPGSVSLQDALKVADDFVVLRSTRQTVREFIARFDFSELARRHNLDFLATDQQWLILSAASGLCEAEDLWLVYDASLRRRLELRIDRSLGYRNRRGQEYLAGGFQILRLWESTGEATDLREHDLKQEGIKARPR